MCWGMYDRILHSNRIQIPIIWSTLLSKHCGVPYISMNIACEGIYACLLAQLYMVNKIIR